jgi:hypothetical protein
MVSTSVTRPIVVGHQPNPKFAIHLDPLPRANAASKPRGRTSSSLTIPGKSASFYCWHERWRMRHSSETKPVRI